MTREGAPLGQAVATGFVRGVLGGAIIAIVALVLLRRVDTAWQRMGEIVVGIVLVSTTLSLGDALADRLRAGRGRAFVRAGAGVLLPFMAFAARFSILAEPLDEETIVGLVVASIAFAVAHGVAAPSREAHPLRALAIEVLGPSLALGLAFFFRSREDVLTAAFVFGAASFIAAFVLLIAHILVFTAHVMATPITRWLLRPLDEGGEAP